MKVELMKYMVNSVELGHSFYHLENLNQFEEFLNEYKPQVLFTSFQIKEIPLTLDQMCEALRLAKKYHTNFIADAGRETLTEENVERLHQAGLKYLRMDEFFDEEQLALLLRYFNPVINASTYTLEEHKLLSSYVSCKSILALHNYYPKRYTGLSLEHYNKINTFLRSLGIKIGAFVPGDLNRREPLCEGLPTIENHRTLTPLEGFVELQNTDVDMIIVGDSGLTPLSNEQVQKANQGILLLSGDVPEALLDHTYNDRVDYSDMLYRVQGTRGMTLISSQSIQHGSHLEKGGIYQSNEQFLRYCGEIDIAKMDLPADTRFNKIGQIKEQETLKYASKYKLQFTISQ